MELLDIDVDVVSNGLLTNNWNSSLPSQLRQMHYFSATYASHGSGQCPHTFFYSRCSFLLVATALILLSTRLGPFGYSPSQLLVLMLRLSHLRPSYL